MNCSRRSFIYGVVPIVTTFSLSLSAAVFAGQKDRSLRPSRPLPGEGTGINPNAMASGPMTANPASARPMLEHNQVEIQDDIKKLYSLAEELKQEVERTNSADVLSIHLVDKAKQVEDLAKQIRNLAKAS
jgi:hypothetical protein